MWIQQKLQLSAKRRGFHLVTNEIEQQLPQLATMRVGILHLFIQHCSASLTINENADPSVRSDLEAWCNHSISDHTDYFVHTYEGLDDMPAHVKASLFGSSVQIPIADGRLLFGTWQGIYLGEHRDHGGARSIIATLSGESYE